MTERLPRRKCKARNRKGRGCGNVALPGQDVCRLHGGASPQALAAAERRLERARITRTLEELLAEAEGNAVGRDPIEHLLDTIKHASGMVSVLRSLVGQLRPAYDWRALSEQVREAEGARMALEAEYVANGEEPPARLPVLHGALYGPDHNEDAKPHVLVVMLGEWTDRLAKYSKLALDAGVAEREVRLHEEQGRLVVTVLRRVLDHYGVNAPDLPQIVGAVLRDVSAIEATAVG